MTPRKLFATFAFAEVVTWTLLLIGMVLKYVTHTTELGVRIGGMLHGFVFLVYVAATIAVGIDRRWPAGTTLLGLASAVIPYATVPFERRVERRGLLDGGWRVRDGERPTTAAEKVLAWVVTHPVMGVLTVLAAVVAVTAVLLMLGPPPVPGR